MALWSTNQIFEIKLGFNEHGLLENCSVQKINRIYEDGNLISKNRDSVETVDLVSMFSNFNHADLTKMLPIIEAEIAKQLAS